MKIAEHILYHRVSSCYSQVTGPPTKKHLTSNIEWAAIVPSTGTVIEEENKIVYGDYSKFSRQKVQDAIC